MCRGDGEDTSSRLPVVNRALIFIGEMRVLLPGGSGSTVVCGKAFATTQKNRWSLFLSEFTAISFGSGGRRCRLIQSKTRGISSA